MLRHLAEEQVGARVHYPLPVHLQPAYRRLGYHVGDFPEAEKACREVPSLPLYPELTEPEVHRVVSAIASCP
jgi:dTDP-4-amino-4,6-dideoxygalactose transaminase